MKAMALVTIIAAPSCLALPVILLALNNAPSSSDLETDPFLLDNIELNFIEFYGINPHFIELYSTKLLCINLYFIYPKCI